MKYAKTEYERERTDEPQCRYLCAKCAKRGCGYGAVKRHLAERWAGTSVQDRLGFG